MSKFWWMIAATILPLGVAGLIGWGELRKGQNDLASGQGEIRAQIETKANKETVDAQYQAILRELQLIDTRLDRMERQ